MCLSLHCYLHTHATLFTFAYLFTPCLSRGLVYICLITWPFVRSLVTGLCHVTILFTHTHTNIHTAHSCLHFAYHVVGVVCFCLQVTDLFSCLHIYSLFTSTPLLFALHMTWSDFLVCISRDLVCPCLRTRQSCLFVYCLHTRRRDLSSLCLHMNKHCLRVHVALFTLPHANKTPPIVYFLPCLFVTRVEGLFTLFGDHFIVLFTRTHTRTH